VKGFGDYAAGNMLLLLGKFDRLGIDTSCREMFREQLNGGNKAPDDEIRSYYEPFGIWRGLVMAMDVMKTNLTKHLNASQRGSRGDPDVGGRDHIDSPDGDD